MNAAGDTATPQRPAAFDPRTAQGLSEAEAARRLASEGPNELPAEKPRSLLAIALEVLRQPMFLLLLGAGVLYLLLGDRQEALTLLSFVLVIIGITLYQERKTERALGALRELSSPRALVIRDGRTRRVAGREVVRGDLVVLAEGDRVPMDGALLEGANLQADESLLTGESVPVRKRPDTSPATDAAARADVPRPGGDDTPWVFSGTLVVRGRGVAEARATGARTEMGRIGKALAELPDERSALQREIDTAVRRVALAGAGLCAVLVVVYGLTRGQWMRGVLAGITLAMAVLPEEFPVVLTVFMALGAWRISRHKVLTRRVPAIEALGATTVLCVDKTGTLTQNRMAVARLVVPDAAPLDLAPPRDDAGGAPGRRDDDAERTRLPEAFHGLIECGILASQRDPFDPMERAFHALGARALAGTEHLHADWILEREYPLSPELLALSHVWRAPDGGDQRMVAAKGAPESIADLCHLSPERTAALLAQTRAMAAEGLRVLGVAQAHFGAAKLPPAQHDFDFELVGLVGLRDPLRAGVPAAVGECRAAGIRVVMITGDYPETARTIARGAGIDVASEPLTGAEIDALDDAALGARLAGVHVVARAAPEHKLRIVRAFKARGEVVAMTGDGVNDAPALRAADIGIAMGGRGTDVAREAAALVLTEDDFESIVAAVRLGRRIYDNLRNAVAYIVAVHVPLVGMSLLPVLARWPLALLPVHVVFMELVIDPACSVVFEAEPAEEAVMRRAPRPPGQRLFETRRVLLAALQGASVFAATTAFYAYALRAGQPVDRARALTFVALLAGNLALIVVNRSWARTALGVLRRRNAAQWWVLLGATAFVLFGLATPPGRALFHFAHTGPADVLLAALAGVASLTWFEVLKLARPGLLGKNHPQG